MQELMILLWSIKFSGSVQGLPVLGHLSLEKNAVPQ